MLNTEFYSQLCIKIQDDDIKLEKSSDIAGALPANRYDVIKAFTSVKEGVALLASTASSYSELLLDEFHYNDTLDTYNRELAKVNRRLELLNDLEGIEKGVLLVDEALISSITSRIDRRVLDHKDIAHATFVKRILESHGGTGMGDDVVWEKDWITMKTGETTFNFQQAIGYLQRFLTQKQLDNTATLMEDQRSSLSRQHELDKKQSRERKSEIASLEAERKYWAKKIEQHASLRNNVFYGTKERKERLLSQGIKYLDLAKSSYNWYLWAMNYRYMRDIDDIFEKHGSKITPDLVSSLEVQIAEESRFIEGIRGRSYIVEKRIPVELDQKDGDLIGTASLNLKNMELPSQQAPALMGVNLYTLSNELFYQLCNLKISAQNTKEYNANIYPLSINPSETNPISGEVVGCCDNVSVTLTIANGVATDSKSTVYVNFEILLVSP